VVHVVDDDASFVKAIARLLRASGFDVATYGSAREFLARPAPEGTGCVLCDLSMPDMDGLALQQALAATANPLPLVFLSGHADVPQAVRAMRDGADDFLTKRSDLGELLRAVERALTHDRERREAQQRVHALRARFDALTERERQVLAEVVRGRLNKQIADLLGIHERTVKLHRTSITAKLGVRSVAELTRLTQEAGMLPDLAPPAARPAAAT
jgi:FixJ family two-component response regulator